jgi:hypothetical protein
VAGWSEARFEQGPLGVLFFYATNSAVARARVVASATHAAWRRAGSGGSVERCS